MTSQTTTYSQSILTLLRDHYGILEYQAPHYPPHQVFSLIVEAHLGKRWVREIQNWIESVGGTIVWNTAEEDPEDTTQARPYNVEVAGNDYRYDEDMDDDVPFSHKRGEWVEIYDHQTGECLPYWETKE